LNYRLAVFEPSFGGVFVTSSMSWPEIKHKLAADAFADRLARAALRLYKGGSRNLLRIYSLWVCERHLSADFPEGRTSLFKVEVIGAGH
jgi:hypothetical protein